MEDTVKIISDELNQIRKKHGDEKFVETLTKIIHDLNLENLKCSESLVKFTLSRLNLALYKLQSKENGNS